MGQRVNIIVATEDKKGKRVNVYHDQWGIGRKCLLHLTTLNYAVYNLSYPYTLTEMNTLDNINKNLFNEYENRYDTNGVILPGKTGNSFPQTVDVPFENFLDPKSVGEFVNKNCDNNNGAMVVHIKNTMKEGDFMPNIEFKFGFLLGSEDAYDDKRFGEAFERWLTLDEWCSLPINHEYADDAFKKIISDYIKYFDLESFT